MNDLLATFCPECDAEVHALVREQWASLPVRGENIAFFESVATCPICGSVIGDARIERDNLERAYAEYRKRHGLMSPAEIRDLRSSYGLSLREFSMFLGFGSQTVYRYEHGDLPDQAHSNALRSAQTAGGGRLLLGQNGSRLSSKSISRIEEHLRSMETGVSSRVSISFELGEREALAPSAENGYRRLSLERAFALVYALSSACKELYWTKLQKAMFFADMVGFERTAQSLTGLTYARATHGPVIDRKDEMRYLLAESGIVGFEECGWGEVVVPSAPVAQSFTSDERNLIDDVARFVNTFSTASELSDFSHELSCWAEREDGRVIEYPGAATEAANAMYGRLALV